MKDQDERSRNPFDYANRHSSDALDRGVTKVLELSPFRSAGSMEMTQFERHKTQQQKLTCAYTYQYIDFTTMNNNYERMANL